MFQFEIHTYCWTESLFSADKYVFDEKSVPLVESIPYLKSPTSYSIFQNKQKTKLVSLKDKKNKLSMELSPTASDSVNKRWIDT